MILWIPSGCQSATSPSDSGVEATDPAEDTSAPDSGATGCDAPVGDWALVDLPGPRESMGIASEDPYVWIVGGWTPSGATDSVWIGTVSDSGVSFVDGPPLPTRIEHPASGLAGGRLWIVGGDDTAGRVQTGVWSAPVDGGSLGAWVEGEPLPGPVTFATGASSGAHLYVVGGLDSFYGSARADVLRLEPGADGSYTLSPEPPLPEGRFAAGAVVHEGWLYVVGGAPSFASDADTVWRAPIATDGSLGGWQEIARLRSGLVTPSVTAVPGALLVAGGLSGWQEAEARVWSVSLADGEVARSGALVEPRLGQGSARIGDRWLLVGGWASWQGAQMRDSAELAALCAP